MYSEEEVKKQWIQQCSLIHLKLCDSQTGDESLCLIFSLYFKADEVKLISYKFEYGYQFPVKIQSFESAVFITSDI